MEAKGRTGAHDASAQQAAKAQARVYRQLGGPTVTTKLLVSSQAYFDATGWSVHLEDPDSELANVEITLAEACAAYYWPTVGALRPCCAIDTSCRQRIAGSPMAMVALVR